MEITNEHKDYLNLAVIKEKLDAAEGGAAVRQNIQRHYEHLETLAASLRKIGMDGREIDENILLIFREYERELNSYMGAI